MAFLIDSLQYYLMADVLDTKMTAFTAKLEKSTSFEEVKLCHDLFLTEVQASIFLHNPQVIFLIKVCLKILTLCAQVQKCLTDLMDNCQQFCKAKSNQVELKMGFNFPPNGIFPRLGFMIPNSLLCVVS